MKDSKKKSSKIIAVVCLIIALIIALILGIKMYQNQKEKDEIKNQKENITVICNDFEKSDKREEKLNYLKEIEENHVKYEKQKDNKFKEIETYYKTSITDMKNWFVVDYDKKIEDIEKTIPDIKTVTDKKILETANTNLDVLLKVIESEKDIVFEDGGSSKISEINESKEKYVTKIGEINKAEAEKVAEEAKKKAEEEAAKIAEETRIAAEAEAARVAEEAKEAQVSNNNNNNSGNNNSQESYDEPSYDEPNYKEPSYEEPSYEEPSYEEPSYDEDSGDDGGRDWWVIENGVDISDELIAEGYDPYDPAYR